MDSREELIRLTEEKMAIAGRKLRSKLSNPLVSPTQHLQDMHDIIQDKTEYGFQSIEDRNE